MGRAVRQGREVCRTEPDGVEKMPVTTCDICRASSDALPGLCPVCEGLLRWLRGYFAHIPDLPEKITSEVRFIEDLGVESLDWMCWPGEAEEKLGVVLPDDQVMGRVRTVGDWIRVLRQAGAVWPPQREILLLPRRSWWSSYRWAVAERKTTT